MDTTAETPARPPYTARDSRDGIKFSIVLGIILGFCAIAFTMLTSISLDNIMLIVGASTVGVTMFIFGMYGNVMGRRERNQLFGFATTVVVVLSIYLVPQFF